MMTVSGRFLVRGDRYRHKSLRVPTNVILSTESLSFWGGIDPITGIVIDTSHPLHGKCVSGTILAIPSGRGSCTASQVLLELILNEKSPKAIVMRDIDGLAAVGALVAQQVFQTGSVDIVHVGDEGFQTLVESSAEFGIISDDGDIHIGSSLSSVEQKLLLKETTNSASDVVAKLTAEEQHMLEKCDNDATRMALHVIYQYAHMICPIGQSPSYRPVSQAHIDGCTYIGPGGLDLAKRLVEAGGKVAVHTTLNSMSTDRRRWSTLGVPNEYASNAIALGNAYLELGCSHSFTCAPYLFDTAPEFGQDIVWGESNAVVFANSVLGARTEKYADYLDICCAIAGIVPEFGVHLEQNRRPTIVLDASKLFSELAGGVEWDVVFPVLGHLCGTLSDGKVPVVTGMEALAPDISKEHLKAFCAAFGTTGTSPLVHVAGVTPEALDSKIVEEWVAGSVATASLSIDQLSDTFATLDSGNSLENDSVSLVALGNPHLSVEECQSLSEMVEGSKKHPNVRIVACLSRSVHQAAEEAGHTKSMETFGVEFINDTCWCMLLDEPIIPPARDARILTNSGKYAHYGPGLTSRLFRFGSTHDCISAAKSGRYPKRGSLTGDAWLRPKRAISTTTLRNTARFALKRLR